VNRLAQAWTGYWFKPAPLLDLAVVRIFAAGTQVLLLLFFEGGFARQRMYAALPDHLYAPIPMLQTFIWPLGLDFRPPLELIGVIWAVAVVAGVFALVGLRTNFALAILAACSVFLKAHEWSYGSIHHPPAIMMVALGALTISPCGRALSLDALWRRERTAGAAGRGDSQTSPFAGWPLRLLQWFFVTMYLSAASHKLINTNLEWANGFALQYFLIMDGLRWNSPLALWLSQFHEFILVMQWLIVLFQLTFALAVLFPRLRWVYVPAGMAMHIGILLTLRAPFFEWIALYSIFIPWSLAFAQVARRWAARRSPAVVAAAAPPRPA